MRRPAMIVDSNERGVLCDSVLRKAEKAGLSVIRKPLVGHLWRQLEKMDINYQRFFLVIHGGIDKYVAMAKKTGKKVTYTRIQNELTGTIARIMSAFECQVFYTPNVSEAALFITKLHNKLHKPASSHGARTIRRVASNDIRADMLLAIPGIGKDMADRILEECGSIEEMCFPESLKKIKGLGEVLRGRIVQALTSEEKMVVERKVKRRV